nr:hypothetical protein GCM10020063_039700 [Dactylosporangium thailandense]
MPHKDTVERFWKQVFQDRDPAGAARAYLGEHYVQHNPNAIDGEQGLLEFVGALTQRDPDFKAELVRIVADGDLVATHSRFDYSTATLAVMDFWRLDRAGRIVEHWDAIQPVPAESRNSNGMF